MADQCNYKPIDIFTRRRGRNLSSWRTHSESYGLPKDQGDDGARARLECGYGCPAIEIRDKGTILSGERGQSISAGARIKATHSIRQICLSTAIQRYRTSQLRKAARTGPGQEPTD